MRRQARTDAVQAEVLAAMRGAARSGKRPRGMRRFAGPATFRNLRPGTVNFS